MLSFFSNCSNTSDIYLFFSIFTINIFYLLTKENGLLYNYQINIFIYLFKKIYFWVVNKIYLSDRI